MIAEMSESNRPIQAAETTLLSRKRRLFITVALLGGILAGLIVAEIGLRLAGYSFPDFYISNDALGYALIPNMHSTYRKEGKSFVRINTDGFHDVEHEIAKASGVKRIAVIGDSYVEALQVEREASFINFIRDETEACGAFGGSRIELLGFGVSGYGTAQELIMLRNKVMKYSPNVVILIMTTNNDISDNSRVFKKISIPYFEYRDGSLTLDNSFRNEAGFAVRNSAISRLGIWLRNNLRVVQAIGEIQISLKYKYKRWKEKSAVETVPAETGIDIQVYRPPTDENWGNAWRVTEGIVDLMKNEVEGKGAKFVVVTASNGIQVVPDVESRTSFAKTLGVDDLFYPDRRIADFCRSKSIPVVTLAPFLADYAAREHVNLHGFEGNPGFGHWNATGHRVAGTEIGRKLCLELVQ